jgi:hypothetical protein
LQWLIGIEDDGLVLVDRKDIVNPEPEVRDANALQLTAGHISCPGCEISPTAEYEITVDWTAGSFDERSGGFIETTNRMYFRKLAGDEVQCYVGELTDNLTVDINSSGYTTLKMIGNGDIYVDGVWQGNTVGNDEGGTTIPAITDTGGGFFVGAQYGTAGSPINFSTMKVVKVKINGQNQMPLSTGYGTTAHSTEGIDALLTENIFNLNPYPLDDLREVVHPDIYIFDEPWNGWTHWMVYTPYPDSNNAFENPSIEVSNNGIDWQAPEGVTNPLVPKPSGQAHAFSSDPELIYETTTDTLNIIYRTSFDTPSAQELLLLTSSDGVNWSGPTQILEVDDADEKLASPTIVWTGSEYFMITHTTTPDTWPYRTAPSLSGPWSDDGICSVLNRPDVLWHQKMRIVDGKFRMLAQLGGSGGGALWWLESDDGINWDFDEGEQVTTGGNYRSTFWPIGTESNRSFRMWLGVPSDWQFLYTKWGAYGEFGAITNGSWITDDNALSNNHLDGFTLGGIKADVADSYFDTGIVDLYEIGAGEKIKIRYKANTDSAGNYVICGRDNSDSFYCNTTIGNVDFWFGGVRLRSPHPEDKDFIAECIYDNGTMSLSVAGGTPITDTTTPNTDTTSLGLLRSPAVGNSLKGTVYWVEIEINDILVSSFYPTPTGEMVDRVTGVVYSKSGTAALATELLPALVSEGNSADGLPTTNPGGYVHNGSECSLIQRGAKSVVSDGSGQYIDMGYVYDENTVYTTTIYEDFKDETDNRIGGSSASRMYLRGTAGVYQVVIGPLTSDNITITPAGIPFTVAMHGNGDVYVDGVKDPTGTGANASANTVGTLGILGLGSGSIQAKTAQGRTTVHQSGVLVRDMVPLPDGEFLDQVNNVIYSNDGTGTLVSDTSVFGGATIWGDGVSTWVKVTYADLLAHVSGAQNTWLKWIKSGSACLIKEDAQYDTGDEFAPAENDRNERYFTQGTCGAGFAALRDVGGELILDVGGNVIYTA